MSCTYEAIHEDAVGYEGYMGRWSRITGQLLVDWLGIPRQSKWLDVGCGTGALTEVILAGCDPRSVVAFDLSAKHVSFAKSRISDDRVRFSIADAAAIDEPTGEFDIAVAGLVLNFISDRRMAVAEMSRVVRAGGVVAATVWDWAGRRNISQHLWDSILRISPNAKFARQSTLRIERSRPEVLVQLLKSANLSDIMVAGLDFMAEYENFDDYWSAHMGFSSSPGLYCRTLPPDKLLAIRREAKARVPPAENGVISYPARVWALRARVPEA